jgi:hypothetical protein
MVAPIVPFSENDWPQWRGRAYREAGKFKIEGRGKPSWAHPVVSGGKLYIRDQGWLTAYDVRAR